MPEYAASKTDAEKAMGMLRANGLTTNQILDLKNQAEGRKGEKAFGYGGWMIAHADGTYSSGAA